MEEIELTKEEKREAGEIRQRLLRVNKALQLLESVEKLQLWVNLDPSERGVTVSFSCKSGDRSRVFPAQAKTHNGDFIRNKNIYCEDDNPIDALISLAATLGGK